MSQLEPPFVLLHGAWHGAWCWKKIAPLLQAHGHDVYTPDLPGHGSNPKPISKVTLESYVSHLHHLMETIDKPVILVGHSMAGVTLSTIAERYPEKIQCLIYLAAFMLRTGESLNATMKKYNASPMSRHLIIAEDKKSYVMTDEGIKKCLYNLCSEEDIKFAKENMCVQSAAPGGPRLKLSDEKYGTVPKYYIRCLQDQTIPIDLQDQMISKQRCSEVYSLDTDHFPLFSSPEELSRLLLEIAEK